MKRLNVGETSFLRLLLGNLRSVNVLTPWAKGDARRDAAAEPLAGLTLYRRRAVRSLARRRLIVVRLAPCRTRYVINLTSEGTAHCRAKGIA